MRAVGLFAPACALLVATMSTAGCDAESPAKSGSPLTKQDGGAGKQGGDSGVGSGSGGVGGSGSGSPTEKCNQVLDVLCKRMVSCDTTSTPATAAADIAACRVDLAEALPCARTTAASPNVPSCVSDLTLISCPSLFTPNGPVLPGSCQGLFMFSAGKGEKQCEDLASVICTRILECDDSIMSLSQADCEEVTIFELECSFIRGVSGTYDMCMSDMRNGMCSVLFPPPDQRLALPMSCLGVLL